ncbi:uncharacterized protein LOC135848432 [Planococcus citri]|uniref:uncharacterized protein LOC135848432 n=1 Tax=Planococcus citri TaxID=170843 RepID=UPI0031F7AD9A
MATSNLEYLSDEFLELLPERMRRLYEMTAENNSPNPGIDNSRRSSFPSINLDTRVTQLRPEIREYDSDGVNQRCLNENQRCLNENQNNGKKQLRRSTRNAAKDADFRRREQLGIQKTPKSKPTKIRDRKLLRSLHENILDQRREWRSAEVQIDSQEYQEALEDGDLDFLKTDLDEIDANGADEAVAGSSALLSGFENPDASINQNELEYELEDEINRSERCLKNIAESKMAQICSFDPVNVEKKIDLKIEKKPDEQYPAPLSQDELIFRKWAYAVSDNHDKNEDTISSRVIDSEKAISKTRDDVGHLYLELRAQMARMKSDLKKDHEKKINDLRSEMRTTFRAYKQTTDHVLTSHVLIMNKMKERNMYMSNLMHQIQMQYLEDQENMQIERAEYLSWKDHVDGFIAELHDPGEPPYQPPVVPTVVHNVNTTNADNTASRSSVNPGKGADLFRGRRGSRDRSRSPAPYRGNTNNDSRSNERCGNNGSSNSGYRTIDNRPNRDRSSSRESRSNRDDRNNDRDHRNDRDNRDNRNSDRGSRDRRDSYNDQRDSRNDRGNRDDRNSDRSSDYNNNNRNSFDGSSNSNNHNRDNRDDRRNDRRDDRANDRNGNDDDQEVQIDPRWIQAEREQQNNPPERRLNYRIRFGNSNFNIRPDRLREFGVRYSEENKYQVYNFLHRFERRMQPYQVSQSQYCDALMVLIDDKLIHMAPWKDLQENNTDYYQLRKDFIDCAWGPQRQNEARNHFRNMPVCKTSSTTQCSELMIWLKVLKTTNSPFEDIIMLIYYKMTPSLRPRFTEIELQDINIFEKRLNGMTRVEEFAQRPPEPERPVTQARNVQQRSENRRSSFGGTDRRSNSHTVRNNTNENKSERTTDKYKKPSYDKNKSQPKSEATKTYQKDRKDESKYKKSKEKTHGVNQVNEEETPSENESSEEQQSPPTSPEGSIDSAGLPLGNE